MKKIILINVLLLILCISVYSDSNISVNYKGNYNNLNEYFGEGMPRINNLKWEKKYDVPRRNYSNVVILDNSLYIGIDNFLFCIDINNGNLIWKKEIDFFWELHIINNNILGYSSGNISLIDPTSGDVIWEYIPEGINFITELTYNKEYIYLLNSDDMGALINHYILAINISSGEIEYSYRIKWKYDNPYAKLIHYNEKIYVKINSSSIDRDSLNGGEFIEFRILELKGNGNFEEIFLSNTMDIKSIYFDNNYGYFFLFNKNSKKYGRINFDKNNEIEYLNTYDYKINNFLYMNKNNILLKSNKDNKDYILVIDKNKFKITKKIPFEFSVNKSFKYVLLYNDFVYFLNDMNELVIIDINNVNKTYIDKLPQNEFSSFGKIIIPFNNNLYFFDLNIISKKKYSMDIYCYN